MPTTTRPEGKPARNFCYYIPADGYVKGKGYRVSIVVEGEHGHYPTGNWPYHGKPYQTMPYFWGHDYETAKQIAAEVNARLGLSKDDVEDIVTSSVRSSLLRTK